MEISFLDFSRIAAATVMQEFNHASRGRTLSEATLGVMQRVSIKAFQDCLRFAARNLNNSEIERAEFPWLDERVFIVTAIANSALGQLQEDLRDLLPYIPSM
ncbi:MAG: hypothetical protein JSR76_04665 [Verrucomicrobia bacterium]|nr:hypothetical protein [Verrucomicrobiota bacterium]